MSFTLKIALTVVLATICAAYNVPKCSDFTSTTAVLPMNLGMVFPVNVGTEPALFRVADVQSLVNLTITAYEDLAFAAGCNTTVNGTTSSSGIIFAELECPDSGIVPQIKTGSWTNTNVTSAVWTATLMAGGNYTQFRYFYVVQSDAPGLTTCAPYAVEMLSMGNWHVPQPNCTNFNMSTPIFTSNLGDTFQVPVGVMPTLFRIPMAENVSSIVATTYSERVAAAGCPSKSTVVISRISCPAGAVTPTAISVTSAGNTSTTGTVDNLYANDFTWFYVYQSIDDSVCAPYMVDMILAGNFLRTCLNGGTLNLDTAVCSCPANVYGETCLISGVCDPSQPIQNCTVTNGTQTTTGVRTCEMQRDYTTVWSPCVLVGNSTSINTTTGQASRAPLYIGIGVGVAIAVVGIIIGYFVSRRRNAYTAI